jgi:hypothetical protein
MTRTVTGPDGTEWTVSRRRAPKVDDEEGDGNGFFDTPLGWFLSLVAAVAYVAVFIVSELAALVIASVLLVSETVVQLKKGGRPWLVEASASGSQLDLAWRVAGRRLSRRVVDQVLEALERGYTELDPPGAERL